MRVRAMSVCAHYVDVVVTVDDPARMRTSGGTGVAERALEVLPGLARHSCSTGAAGTFIEEMRDTEVPHLFEHMVLELLAAAGSSRSLTGETVWRHGDDAFRVRFHDEDDVVTLGAIKLADRLMEYVLDGGECPDVTAAVRRLAELRGMSTDDPA